MSVSKIKQPKYFYLDSNDNMIEITESEYQIYCEARMRTVVRYESGK